MPYKVFVIKADGTTVVTEQAKAPSYQQQVDAVGGYIETVPYFNTLVHEGVTYRRGTAYANEEGKLKGLPHNLRATALWMESCPDGDPTRMLLTGDVIFYARVK